MVQEHTDVLSFFTSHTANNDTYSPEWGPSFRALRQQVQNERPNFSDETRRFMSFGTIAPMESPVSSKAVCR